MHEPDIPQLEVQKSMARIREATSKTQEAPAKILNKELVKDLPAEFKIKLFPFRLFLDKSLIFLTSFRQILDTFRRNISLDQLSISTKRYIRPVVLFDQMSYSTKCLSTNCRGSRVSFGLNPCEITLSFTDVGKSCPGREFAKWQICFLTRFVKISQFTVANQHM